MMGYRDPFTGDVYKKDDPRLVGRGCPCTCPMGDGMGNIPMEIVADADADPNLSDPSDGRRIQGGSAQAADYNKSRARSATPI